MRDATFPAAEGVRRRWAEVPEPVRRAIEHELGSVVVAAVSQPSGFSPGVAARLRLADGTRAFVKAVSSTPNADSPRLYRREARIAAALPSSVPAPAFRFFYDDGEWVALGFEEVDGHPPRLPWEPDELTRVLQGVFELSRALTPSPIEIEPMSETLAVTLQGWQRLAADPAAAAALSAGWRARLDELVVLELQWPEATSGESLVHLDVRADNVLLTTDRVVIVDWPWAARGAPWVDLVAMLPSVAMQGGPDPETVWSVHPLSRGVDGERVDAFIAAHAGMLTYQSGLPPAPGLPTLRAFQAAQAQHARAWLAQRRGW